MKKSFDEDKLSYEEKCVASTCEDFLFKKVQHWFEPMSILCVESTCEGFFLLNLIVVQNRIEAMSKMIKLGSRLFFCNLCFHTLFAQAQ